LKLVFNIIGIVFLFISNSTWCQEIKTTNDIGLWAGVGGNFKLNKKWKTSFNQEIRTFNNAIKIKKSITELGLTHKFDKQLKLSLGVRYSYARKRDYTFVNNIRYNIDIKYWCKLSKHLNLLYRFRYQHSYINLFANTTPDIENRSSMRNRIKLQYPINKHAIYISAELFREYVIYKKPSFNKVRLNIGDKLKTNLGDVKYGLAFERELNNSYPLNYIILKINYSFNFKHG
tara:strand:+ start:6959 stop:7651 length:693 start_codon:yes stop_codon:yes gene_type:complete